jgi:hypothetical protein
MKETGIGLDVILFVVFLILKLTGHIDWSWWWVTSPLWIPIATVITFIILGIIVTAIIEIFT